MTPYRERREAGHYSDESSESDSSSEQLDDEQSTSDAEQASETTSRPKRAPTARGYKRSTVKR